MTQGRSSIIWDRDVIVLRYWPTVVVSSSELIPRVALYEQERDSKVRVGRCRALVHVHRRVRVLASQQQQVRQVELLTSMVEQVRKWDGRALTVWRLPAQEPVPSLAPTARSQLFVRQWGVRAENRLPSAVKG